jgi:hypothetical protein
MTARELIRLALVQIGAVASTAPMRDDEAQDGLLQLQGLLDTLRTHRLTIAGATRTVLTVTTDDGSYNLATGQVSPDWNAQRPLRLEAAGLVDTSGYETPLRILTDVEYARIVDKAQTGWPTCLYLRNDYPTAVVELWPVPSSSSIASVALYLPLASNTSITVDSALVLPPGAQEALMYQLAVRLAPSYGRPVDPIVAQLAADTLGSWKRSNIREALLDIDLALLADPVGFDYRTGV